MEDTQQEPRKRGRPSTPGEVRFKKYVSINESTGCWEWTGALDPSGYGAFKDKGKKINAHRWSYEHHRGTIPEGLQLDHLCRVRKCVNPDHLEPVTGKVNTRRGLAGKLRATHCIHGHPYTWENTYWRKQGDRECRTCKYYGGRGDPSQKKEASRVEKLRLANSKVWSLYPVQGNPDEGERS